MEDILTIELPTTLSRTELNSLRDEVIQISGVEDADTQSTRSVDMVTLNLWIQFATGVLGAASTGVPIVQKIVEMVRGKGIKGAKITLANGVTVVADEISLKDLEKLIQASSQQPGSAPAPKAS